MENIMKFKYSVIATAVTAALCMGAAGQAAASVYGLSTVEISNLNLNISPFAGAKVTTFNFNLANAAQLNNGVVAASGNSCSNGSCNGSPNILDAHAVNAPGSTALQGENTFTVHGPGTQQYANADSVIYTAQLSSGGLLPSHTQNIAEAELQNGTSASANSTIDSTTGFVFSFTTDAPGTLNVGFTAILNMLAAITAPDPVPNGTASAQTRINASIKLENAAGDFVLFRPTGGASDCVTSNALAFTCDDAATKDPFSLNTNFGVTSQNSSGFSGTDAFAFAANLLGSGAHTLTYTESKSVLLTRTVPEPGVMALLGIGLLGMGWSSRRKFNA
jgi:hypothetical protein